MNNEETTSGIDLLAGEAEFITKLPGPSGMLKVKVKPLNFRHCRWWDKNVQCHIDSSFKDRADNGWNWPLIYIMTKLSTLRYPVYGFSILAKSNANSLKEEYLPIGMAIVVRNYPYLNDHEKKSSFLWFLSSLPKSLFANLGLDSYKAVGRGVIDSVLCDAFKNWLLGVVSLHADPAGGDDLLNWYSSIGMEQIDKDIDIPKPRGILKKNDGRYFSYLPTENIKAYMQLLEWR